jgi:hypothetical protein
LFPFFRPLERAEEGEQLLLNYDEVLHHPFCFGTEVVAMGRRASASLFDGCVNAREQPRSSDFFNNGAKPPGGK